MKISLIILSLLMGLFVACNQAKKNTLPTPEDVLQKSIWAHDSLKEWKTARLKLNIAEPRLETPKRFSVVELNNETGEFSLSRDREGHLVTYTVDAASNVVNYLDGATNYDSLQISTYMLQKERTVLYKDFYQLLLGIPMSLSDKTAQFLGVEKAEFDGQSVFKLTVKLKEKVISDQWNIFIDQETFVCIGIEMIFPEDDSKGERIIMKGELQVGQSLILPRFRHWYHVSNVTYAGSDILMEANR